MTSTFKRDRGMVSRDEKQPLLPSEMAELSPTGVDEGSACNVSRFALGSQHGVPEMPLCACFDFS